MKSKRLHSTLLQLVGLEAKMRTQTTTEPSFKSEWSIRIFN